MCVLINCTFLCSVISFQKASAIYIPLRINTYKIFRLRLKYATTYTYLHLAPVFLAGVVSALFFTYSLPKLPNYLCIHWDCAFSLLSLLDPHTKPPM
jgi:hypothetical protein